MAAEQLPLLSKPEPTKLVPHPRRHSPVLCIKKSSAIPTEVYQTYWHFAAERQAIFHRRISQQPAPWTDDPILREFKFTNVYRASDRVSQYLIRHVIYSGSSDFENVFFRILLFKLFNRIETWEILVRALGEPRWETFNLRTYDRILENQLLKGKRIYSAAYIMPTARDGRFSRKHTFHLHLLATLMTDRLPERILLASTMRDAFVLLKRYPTIGAFLAYQYVTDLNYAPQLDWSEMEFVAAGPGARDGIRKCFSFMAERSDEDIVRMMVDSQEDAFGTYGLSFQSLWGRPLQLIDCQNLFCEVGKYARVKHPGVVGLTGRTRIKQRYRRPAAHFELWYPPKWGINEAIPKPPDRPSESLFAAG